MSRRRPFIILFLLALLTTLASAWVPAGLDQSGPQFFLSVNENEGRVSYLWNGMWYQTRRNEGAPAPLPDDPYAARRTLHALPMVNSEIEVLYPPNLARSTFVVHEWGAPWRCFWSWSGHQDPPATGGLPSTDTFGGALELSSSQYSIPYLPIWSGLISNTLFYFAAFNILIAACRATLTVLRRRRGQCAHCTYDLRGTPPGSPCPECGSPRSESTHSSLNH